MGLYQRAGSPFWMIRYADQHGRIRRCSTGTTEKKLAKAILDKRKTEVVENRHLDILRTPSCTFHELCNEYWRIRGANMRTHGIKYTLDIWKEEFGNPQLLEITQQKIESFLAGQAEKRKWGRASKNRYLIIMKSIFNKAVEWSKLRESPAKGIRLIREDEARTRFLTAEEIDKLLSSASKKFRPLLTVALHTGMRRGEIFRLHWADIDFQTRLITVQKSKSGKRRSIPMDDTIHNMLRELPSRFKGGVVFPSQTTGEELTDVSRIFPPLCEKAGLEGVRFHDLRHTFASHLVMRGVDLRTVQELLGHANLAMTMRYSHLAPEHRAKAVCVLDTAFSGGAPSDTINEVGHAELTKPLESAI